MLLKKFFRYVIPSIVSMWVFALYTMVDGMFVAWGVGERALASVNLSMPYVILIFSIGLLMATGTSTLIAIALGQNREEEASSLFSMNMVVLAAVSIGITALSLIFLEPLAFLLGASEDNLGYVKEYVGTISVFAVFFILSYNMEALVKTDGTPLVSSAGVVACGLTNVVLDYIFVMKLHLGVTGAALATGLSQAVSTVIFFTYFKRFRKKLRLCKFRWNLKAYKKIIPLGLANGFTELSGGLVMFLFNQTILHVMGEQGVVSYTVVSYINTLVLNTMAGITQGMQPLTSYHYGASQREQCRKLLRYSLIVEAVVSAVYLLVLELFPQVFVGGFLGRGEEWLFNYTVRALRLYSLSFIFIGFNVVSAGYFTAMERPWYSLFISAGRGLFFLAGALAAMVWLLGEPGIWLSPLISEFICAALALFFFIRQRKTPEKRK